ncbi:GreA/GreB family elongation factor [Mycobacterium antarcticum]|uniref:GreA/GreB family elongation factor n=1 Tax=Mycolicibacterium sp. TUM20984 TaxID=3023368 RepID=UPI0023973740|nr:GreA/GreB family elongation factor [Mycolicibacterium sp. TUM20984]GLP80950.1 transcription elongation factor GreA [Mycolicibacterium sp. TUM20984]
MTSTERIWMTPQAHSRLQTELSALCSRPSIEVPEDFMEYDDTLVANHVARRVRIRQLEDLLKHAVVGEDPPDDGIAEPGMVLTIRYDDTGEIETFLLGVRGAEDAGIEVYSIHSPLGSAIAGARVGEQRTYGIPNGTHLPVTLLKAVPYSGITRIRKGHRASTAARHSPPARAGGHTATAARPRPVIPPST